MMGLASGMDTDFIIQQTLRMHQFKIDNQLRNRKLIEWRQQTHNTIKDEITNLRQTFLSNLGSKSMMNRNAFNSNVANASGRNADAVTLRALPGSQLSNFRIGQISQLARGARAVSDQRHQGTQSSASLGSLAGLGFSGSMEAELRVGNTNVRVSQAEVEGIAGVGGIDWSDKDLINRFNFANQSFTVTRTNNNRLDFSFGEGDKKVEGHLTFDASGVATAHVPPTGDTAADLANQQLANELALNTRRVEEGGNVTFTRQGTTMEFVQEHTFTPAGGGPEITLTRRANGDIQHNGVTLDYFNERKLKINDSEITLRSNMTINDMVNAVNNMVDPDTNRNAGVRMSFEPLTGRFTIESTTTGAASRLDLNDTDTNTAAFFNALGITSATMVFEGQNAKAFINGDEIESTTNTFTFSGVSITLNRITDGGTGADNDTNPGGNITVNVTRDTTTAIARIREFIDSYNAIIRRLEGLLNERKTGNEASYKPLTDEEKMHMSDRQIEEWEAIARKGIMRSDNSIQNLVFNLRRTFFDQIEGMGMSASQLGLTTGAHHEGTGGQIMINEERLRAALEEDPDRVADIFIKIGTDPVTGAAKGEGLLHKIDDLMRTFVNTSQSTSLRNLEESLKRANEQIQRMQDRMFAEEDRLYRQFAAMETAMSRLQQQGDWFGAMLGTGR
jgi:flagellar hook-associated protein 2